MKNIGLLLLGVVALIWGACTKQSPTPAEVAAKIDSHQVLTQTDYTVIIDYCGDYAKQVQQYFNLINEQLSDTTMDYIRASGEIANIRAANPYLDMFQTALYGADDAVIGKDNVKKVKEYQKYDAFPLPDGSGPALSIPGTKGEVVQVPTESSSVIAVPEVEIE